MGALVNTAAETRIISGVATDVGCVREINEDAIQVVEPASAESTEKRGILAIVCDGMGGHEAGEVASRLAIEAFVRQMRDDGKPNALLLRAMEAANLAVLEAGTKDAKLKGMGTTCTALLVRDGLASCVHVGDSRCYMLRDAQLFLMTEDHSAVMELVRRGAITLEEARHHPDKNVISRALGSVRNVPVTSWPQPLIVRPGDAFLICSDGLYDLVSDDDIRAAMSAELPQAACDRLVAMARERGGHDNISVAMLEVGERVAASRGAPKATRTVEAPQA